MAAKRKTIEVSAQVAELFEAAKAVADSAGDADHMDAILVSALGQYLSVAHSDSSGSGSKEVARRPV